VRPDGRRLGIADPTGRFRDDPYAGRVGGGLGLRLDERATVALEGSTIVQPGPVATDKDGVVGLKLRLRF